MYANICQYIPAIQDHMMKSMGLASTESGLAIANSWRNIINFVNFGGVNHQEGQ
jgi:hypothetical protein